MTISGLHYNHMVFFFGVWCTGKRNSTENKPNIPQCHILNEPRQINSGYIQGHNQTPKKNRPIFWKTFSVETTTKEHN